MNIKNVMKFLLLAAIVFAANNASAQGCAKFDAFPGGEEEGKKTHVLYHDLVGKEQYEEAFPMWQKLMEHSPAGHVYHFIDGVTIYKSFIERDAADEAAVEQHKETIVSLIKQRLECLSAERNDKGIVLENLAYTMSEIGYSDAEKTLAAYAAAVAENGNKTSAYILAYYGDHAIFMYGNDMINKDKAREIYMTLEAIKDANKDKEDYATNWKYVEEYYAPYLDYIFDCDFFKKKLKPEYDAAPDNYEVFRPILKTLLQKGCSQDDPFIAEMIEKDKKQGAIEMAAKMEEWKQTNPDKYASEKMLEGNVEEAITYFNKALSMDLDAERLAFANFKLGKIYHSQSQYGKARGYYNKAADLKGGWGDPYIEIGKMYASSVASCGAGDGFQMGVVVCAALDMWSKAKSIDGGVASEANNLIGKYSGAVPTKEDAFQRGVSAGQSVSVGCWIGGSTSLRLRSQY